MAALQNSAGRAIAGLLAVVGILSALAVATHPAGLSAEWLSWLGYLAAASLALVAILPSIAGGTVTAGEMQRAIDNALTPAVPPAASGAVTVNVSTPPAAPPTAPVVMPPEAH